MPIVESVNLRKMLTPHANKTTIHPANETDRFVECWPDAVFGVENGLELIGRFFVTMGNAAGETRALEKGLFRVPQR